MRLAPLVCLTLALAGCGGGADPLGTPGGADVAEVVEDVDYYYACGNEVLELPDGRSWYPLLDQDAIDEADYLSGPAAPRPDVVLAGATIVLAVAEPGPGDDVGTLTVYEDGIAHFRSESGIEAWLTDEEQTYEWEC